MERVLFFIGTTAELIKVFPIMIEMEKRSIPYKVIASGQNDIRNSNLFDKFSISKPSIVISNGEHKQSALGLMLWFVKTAFNGYRVLDKKIYNRRKSIMIVHGDTVSTVMGAVLGKLLGMKVAHVEAGLRSYNYFNPFPEELDRVITSRFADFHYAPNDWAENNLKNKKGDIINTGENTLLDSLRLAQEVVTTTNEVLDSLNDENYFVFVLHRQENLFDTDFVKFMIERCTQQAEKHHCVLVLHELTKIKLQDMGLLSSLQGNSNFTLIPRLPYLDFMKVLGNCEYLVTDGGSNQEESYYLGKPCLILRTHTERIEGLDENVLLSKKCKNTINGFFENIETYKTKPRIYDCLPSDAIAKHLADFLLEDGTV